MWGTMVPTNSTVFGAVYTSWFICTNCGFAETWVERKEDREKIKKKLSAPDY